MRKYLIYFGILLVFASGLVWWTWPSNKPAVIVCDVGQGDGMIITQGMSQMVIDVGRSNDAMVNCLGKVMPFWDREIEMLVITHADNDHSGGLGKVLAAYTVDRVMTSEKAVDAVREIVGGAVSVSVATMGQMWSWGEVTVSVMWPPLLPTLSKSMASSTNDTGIVLRLVFGDKDSAWLAADAGEAVEQLLIEMGKVKPTTMLKISHHGSKYATTSRFLTILQPRYFVVSVGKNSYGHPSKEVLTRIKPFEGEVWRTDEQGMWRWVPND